MLNLYESKQATDHEEIQQVRLSETLIPAAEATITKENLQGPLRRILVVDDNKELAESLGMTLKLLGHDVRTAYGGEQAVATAAEFRPTLVLMDLSMPNLDGYEAARCMRAQPWDNEVFLVAVTGWGTENDRQRTQAGGFDGHLLKPVDLYMLKKLITKLPIKST